MKKAIFSLIGAALLVLSCEDTIKQKDLSVELNTESVTVAYGSTAELTFSASDICGQLAVSFGTLPEGLTATCATVRDGGVITFSSKVDRTASFPVDITFKDAATSVTRTATVNTLEMERIFSVTLGAQSLSLMYGAPATLSFTADGFRGDVTVSLPDNEKDMTISAAFDADSKSGTVTFSAAEDKALEKTVTLTFRNGESTVTKDIKVIQNPVPEDFSVTMDADAVVLDMDDEATVGYTAAGFEGNVTASLPAGESDMKLMNRFNPENGRGELSFTTDRDQDLDKTVQVTFSNGDDRIVKDIKVTQTRKPTPILAPTKVTLKADSDIIYPASSNYPVVIEYSVESESDIDIVNIDFTGGLRCVVTQSDDKLTGTIKAYAESTFGETGTVTVTASNGAGSASAKHSVRKAWLSLEKRSYDISAAGGKTEARISANVPYGYEITANPGNMISVVKNGDVYSVTVSENTDWEPRTATIVFTDEKGLLSETFTVNQDATTGSPASDKAALMAIYNALNGPNWPDQGGAADRVYSSWGCDDITKWYGVEIFYSGTKAQRVRDLVFIDVFTKDYTLRRGEVPEDLGRLTYLQEFRINKSMVTKIPESIGNLTDMRSILINENPLNFRLDQHEGLKRLVQGAKNLKEFMLINCGLYGSIPEWMGDLYNGKTELDRSVLLSLEVNYLSGQVPDKVAKSSGWISPQWIDLDRDGYYEKITEGELIMRQQGGDGSYALWVGEKPDNVKFVDDAHGGHWEWIGPNPYRDNSRYEKDYNEGIDPDKGASFYNNYGCY